jgi:septum formation protein
MFHMLQPLVLASSSPRRKDLLLSLGLVFDVIPSGVDETPDGQADPQTLVRKWAAEKVAAVADLRPESWVLGADTIVVLDDMILGKPTSPEDAGRMLHELSGRTHQVISGMCLMRQRSGYAKTLSVATMVVFKKLSDREIAAYVSTGEPLDKAGAYGIQGKGSFLVKSVQGSYTNVVGLPLCETMEWLLEEGVIEPR